MPFSAPLYYFTGENCILYTKIVKLSQPYRNLEKPAPHTLCGRELPWVNQADHLGNMLTVQGDMEQDAAVKRAQFISSSVQQRLSST